MNIDMWVVGSQEDAQEVEDFLNEIGGGGGFVQGDSEEIWPGVWKVVIGEADLGPEIISALSKVHKKFPGVVR